MNDYSRTRVNNPSRNKFIGMDPDKAWELMDEFTTFDVQFGQETDSDEEDGNMRSLLQSLRACQICKSNDHGARECNAYQELNKYEGWISQPSDVSDEDWEPQLYTPRREGHEREAPVRTTNNNLAGVIESFSRYQEEYGEDSRLQIREVKDQLDELEV